MQMILLAAVLGLAQVPSGAPAPAPAAPTQVVSAPAVPLSFHSESLGFIWDRTIPLAINLDGLKVTSIFFNQRKVEQGFFSFLKNAEFGTRAQLEVTNTSNAPRIPGFAVAVLDKDGRLIGAASGGTKLGTIKPGETETFDLNFSQVKERLASGDRFLLAIELRN